MEKRNIIVVGASAGGFEALKTLAANLPADLDASIFVVWHMAATVRGVLPQVLNRFERVGAVTPHDGEKIKSNRIYVARPDYHMLIDDGRIHLSRGPKENRFRPAIDPLFRSAAREYGNRVIGVILSGSLDDGSAGLWTVKSRGGVAVVQDPRDAEVPAMPENAMRAVAVDHIVPIAEMAELLARLANEEVLAEAEMQVDKYEEEKTDVEIKIAANADAFEIGVMKLGELSPFTCPECHGVLSILKDGDLKRFRCHTGHAYSPDTLLAAVSENIEDGMWNALRSIEESVMLLNHLGDHFAEVDQGNLAAAYFVKANEAKKRIKLLREAVLSHESLTIDTVNQESEADDLGAAAPASGDNGGAPANPSAR